MTYLHHKSSNLTAYRRRLLRWLSLRVVIPASLMMAVSMGAETKVVQLDWHMRPAGSSGIGEPLSSSENMRFPAGFPVQNEVVCPVPPEAWEGWRSLEVEIELPPDFPGGAYIYFFAKDWDHLWRQVRRRVPTHPNSSGTVKFELPLSGEAAATTWEPKQHGRPWHALTAGQIRRFGLRLADDDRQNVKWSGQLRIQQVRLKGRIDSERPPVVRDIRLSPAKVQVGQMCEVRMQVSGYYRNPFNDSEVRINAKVTRPDGEIDQVRGFYYEGFVPGVSAQTDELIPYGSPEFRVRYTPRTAGLHKIKISINGSREQVNVRPMEFQAEPAAPEYSGYVRVDQQNPQFLEFDDGSAFCGVGLNMRTPSDTRYLKMAPFSDWRDDGIEVYRRMFPKLAAAGVNTVEVWMASWWLALEWINDAPGYHGVGYYNQYRSWLLDEVVRLAEEYDIRIILVLNNHGKFSAFCDEEWERNPYNRRNGGWLHNPNQYFTDEHARNAFKRTVDYIVARWGYSPNILCWKLFSEIDLAGNAQGTFRRPFVKNWHAEMAKYLQKVDPYDHPVTTHWSSNYTRINDAIADIPALDFLTTDAYNGSTRHIVRLFRGTVNYGGQHGKPALITEFGGSPMGDSIGTLKKQLHLSLWNGYFTGHAILPMFWWFELIEEQDWYDEYGSLTEFAGDLDRRQMKSSTRSVPGKNMPLHILNDNKSVLAWGYDRDYFYSRTENAEGELIKDVAINVSGLDPGNYTIEIWDCGRLKPVESRSLKIYRNSDKSEIKIPPFRRDFALKIVP